MILMTYRIPLLQTSSERSGDGTHPKISKFEFFATQPIFALVAVDIARI